MKKLLALLVMTTANVFAMERQQLMPLVEGAATATSNAYLKIRDKIVDYGKDAIPILGEIAVDESLPWQQRLVARICYERIVRKGDIEKLIATDWYTHPKFNPDWNNFITGPEINMGELVVPELKETGLWYYYIEQEWKMTGEDGKISKSRLKSRWARWCTRAVKDNPEERIWFLRVCSELMVISPSTSQWSDWLFPILLREEKPDSAYLLEHRVPPPVTSEPPFRLGTNIVKRVNQP